MLLLAQIVSSDASVHGAVSASDTPPTEHGASDISCTLFWPQPSGCNLIGSPLFCGEI